MSTFDTTTINAPPIKWSKKGTTQSKKFFVNLKKMLRVFGDLPCGDTSVICEDSGESHQLWCNFGGECCHQGSWSLVRAVQQKGLFPRASNVGFGKPDASKARATLLTVAKHVSTTNLSFPSGDCAKVKSWVAWAKAERSWWHWNMEKFWKKASPDSSRYI